MDATEAISSNERLHGDRRLHERPEVIPTHTTNEILKRHPRADIPTIARIGERQQPACVLRCVSEKGRVIWIAADHPMHDHDVGWGDVLGQSDEITDHALHSIGHLSPTSLGGSRVETGGRGVDKSRGADAFGEKLEVEDADSRADIEHRVAVSQLTRYRVEEQTRRGVRTFPTVAVQITCGAGWTKLRFSGGAT
jgi:hypothetical protein